MWAFIATNVKVNEDHLLTCFNKRAPSWTGGTRIMRRRVGIISKSILWVVLGVLIRTKDEFLNLLECKVLKFEHRTTSKPIPPFCIHKWSVVQFWTTLYMSCKLAKLITVVIYCSTQYERCIQARRFPAKLFRLRSHSCRDAQQTGILQNFPIHLLTICIKAHCASVAFKPNMTLRIHYSNMVKVKRKIRDYYMAALLNIRDQKFHLFHSFSDLDTIS